MVTLVAVFRMVAVTSLENLPAAAVIFTSPGAKTRYCPWELMVSLEVSELVQTTVLILPGGQGSGS